MKTTTLLLLAGILAIATSHTEPPTAGAISSPAAPRSAPDDASGGAYTPPVEAAKPCACTTCTDCKCETPDQCQVKAVSAAAPVACAFVAPQPVYQQPTGHYEARPAGLFGRRTVQVWVPHQPVGRSTFGRVYSGCSSCGGS